MFGDLCNEAADFCANGKPDLFAICEASTQFYNTKYEMSSSLFSVCGFNDTVCADANYTGLC